MNMASHAIFFLQRLNLIPRGYIILDETRFPQNVRGFAENL